MRDLFEGDAYKRLDPFKGDLPDFSALPQDKLAKTSLEQMYFRAWGMINLYKGEYPDRVREVEEMSKLVFGPFLLEPRIIAVDEELTPPQKILAADMAHRNVEQLFQSAGKRADEEDVHTAYSLAWLVESFITAHHNDDEGKHLNRLWNGTKAELAFVKVSTRDYQLYLPTGAAVAIWDTSGGVDLLALSKDKAKNQALLPDITGSLFLPTRYEVEFEDRPRKNTYPNNAFLNTLDQQTKTKVMEIMQNGTIFWPRFHISTHDRVLRGINIDQPPQVRSLRWKREALERYCGVDQRTRSDIITTFSGLN